MSAKQPGARASALTTPREPSAHEEVDLRRELMIFSAFVLLATYSGVSLVTKRTRMVSIAYEGRRVDMELKRAKERLKQLHVTRSELVVPQRLEGFAGRHGYRSAEAGQIVLIQAQEELR